MTKGETMTPTEPNDVDSTAGDEGVDDADRELEHDADRDHEDEAGGE